MCVIRIFILALSYEIGCDAVKMTAVPQCHCHSVRHNDLTEYSPDKP